MPATLSRQAVPDAALTHVQLDELIALRQRVVRAAFRHAPEHATAGEHAGRHRGRGMDYLESRAYQAGDDIRHLDWRLTARSGHLHTKVFQEEHEHGVMLLIDTHASMHFGTRGRFKSVQAALAAALAAWQVARAGGRVGALALGPCRKAQRAVPGQRGALAVCAALARWDAAWQTSDNTIESLSAALQRMRPLLRGTGHVVLVSDGRCGDEHMQATLAAWRHHRRVSVLLVTDPLETGDLPRGRYPLDCAGRRITVDLTDARAMKAFQRELGAPAQRMQALCRSLGVACRRIDTRTDPLEAVSALTGLAGRRRRR